MFVLLFGMIQEYVVCMFGFCFLRKGRKSLFLRVQKCLQKSKMDKNKCPKMREAKYFLEKG